MIVFFTGEKNLIRKRRTVAVYLFVHRVDKYEIIYVVSANIVTTKINAILNTHNMVNS